MSKTFEESVHDAIESAIVKGLKSGEWFRFDWSGKMVISPSMLREVYEKVDMGRVAQIVKGKIEERIADACFNALATEIATDVKKIMSNTELREDCRAVIREKIRVAAKGLE